MSSGLGYPMLPVTSIHWHTHKGCCSARRHNWCWVCWGGSNLKHTETPITESAFLIFDFKEVADIMKDIERQAYFRTGRRCTQGPDLALSKPTWDTSHHSSFEKTIEVVLLWKRFAANCTGYLLSKFHDTTCGTFLCGNENPKSSDTRQVWLRQPQAKWYGWINLKVYHSSFQCIPDLKATTGNEK